MFNAVCDINKHSLVSLPVQRCFGRGVCRAWSVPSVMLLSGLTASLA